MLDRRDCALISAFVGARDGDPRLVVDGPSYFYTDDEVAVKRVPSAVSMRHLMPHVTNPRLRSKLPKMMAHALHPEFKAYAWADGSISSQAGFVDELLALLGDADCAFSPHIGRKSIGDEMDFVEWLITHKDASIIEAYGGQPMRAQVAAYRAQGLPDTCLYQGGLFVRRNTPKVNAAFEEWFSHNVVYSVQDQLSLPFVLWKHGVRVARIPSVLRGNTYSFVGHDPGHQRISPALEPPEPLVLFYIVCHDDASERIARDDWPYHWARPLRVKTTARCDNDAIHRSLELMRRDAWHRRKFVGWLQYSSRRKGAHDGVVQFVRDVESGQHDARDVVVFGYEREPPMRYGDNCVHNHVNYTDVWNETVCGIDARLGGPFKTFYSSQYAAKPELMLRFYCWIAAHVGIIESDARVFGDAFDRRRFPDMKRPPATLVAAGYADWPLLPYLLERLPAAYFTLMCPGTRIYMSGWKDIDT